MSLYNRQTVLEDFSAELFFEIFDYFDFNELFNIFSNLNQRIDHYLTQLSSIYLNFKQNESKLTRKLNEKQLLCVKSIKFQIREWRKYNEMEEFFNEYPLKLFRELRSLTSSFITSSNEISMIINQLSLLSYLTYLNIKFDLFQSKLTIDELRHTFENIFRGCITLKIFSIDILDHLDPRKRIYNKAIITQTITTKIKYFNIYELYIDEFDCLLSPLFLSEVKSFIGTIFDYLKKNDSLKEGLTLNSLVYLQLSFHWRTSFPFLESVFKRTPNLKTFIIASAPITLIDCQKWQYFLSRYLLKMVRFHLHACDWEDWDWSNRKEYKDFQTSTYWIKERNGTIHTEYEQVCDEEGSDIDSIIVNFKAMPFQSWSKKCSYCYRYHRS